ncbi:hypothetical protein K493DRAFT_371234 [Basidiobolus meristosporus CBS 931.73]|uniref:Uncharacterized protein n=1 Tax=Basidiobolus meristosporus CBS 931.73 TaxID=1314790 RepID=A0A1Y1YDX7_9FUNG|nr:hypothetical protein K493DRAFT_371234 [Basidiobolus meristosporus CBS 931.73]|eukprot:ORX96202.1 hypothetical protein K493DRAFT_371234 [Basidiobolus meristosporus CBS 931.73]
MFVQKKKESGGPKVKTSSRSMSSSRPYTTNPSTNQNYQNPASAYPAKSKFQGFGSGWNGSRSSHEGNPILAVMPKTSSVLSRPTKPVQKNSPNNFFGNGAIRSKAVPGARFNPMARPGSAWASAAGKASNQTSAIQSRPNVAFSEEQKKVLYLALDHHQSIFFTGSAGQSIISNPRLKIP